MFAKLSILILALTLTAVALLSLRQERLQLTHEIALAHRRIDQMRLALWQTQSKVARLTQPQALRQAIAQCNLQLEPLTLAVQEQLQPKPALDNPVRVADRGPGRRMRY